MKLTLDSRTFIEAVQWAMKNFDNRDDKAFVALQVSPKGEAFLAHTNLTSYMKSYFTVLDSDLEEESVGIALQGQYLQRLASSLDPDGVSVITYKDSRVELTNKLGKFTIPTFQAKMPKEPELKELGEVENLAFFDSLLRLSKLCDPATAGYLPVLGTVDINLSPDDGKVTIMATDRYTLGEISIDYVPSDYAETFIGARSENDGKSNLLLPYEVATLIPPTKGDVGATQLVFEEKGGKFGYSFSSGKLALFALKDAEPIKYDTLKTNAEESIVNTVQLNTKELQKAISVISSLSWEESEIYFDISDDKFVVADSSRSQALEVTMEDGEMDNDYKVSFMRSVINSAFSPISTAKMNLKWANERSGFILEAVLEDGTIAENVFVLAVPRV